MHVAGSCGAPGGTPSPEGGKRDLISGGRALGLVEEGRERLRGLEAARSIPGWGSGVPGLALHGAAFGYFGGPREASAGQTEVGTAGRRVHADGSESKAAQDQRVGLSFLA